MTLLNAVLQNDTVKVLVLDNQKSLIECFKEPNTAIAIAAIFLSLAGIIASIILLNITIRHNKLSVEPRITTDHILKYETNYLQVILTNKGLGSAIIKSFDIYYKGEGYKNFKDILKKNCIKIKPDTQFAQFEKNYLISSNERMSLFKHICKDSNERESIIRLLRESRINMEYESMYGVKRNFNKTVNIIS